MQQSPYVSFQHGLGSLAESQSTNLDARDKMCDRRYIANTESFREQKRSARFASAGPCRLETVDFTSHTHYALPFNLSFFFGYLSDECWTAEWPFAIGVDCPGASKLVPKTILLPIFTLTQKHSIHQSSKSKSSPVKSTNISAAICCLRFACFIFIAGRPALPVMTFPGFLTPT